MYRVLKFTRIIESKTQGKSIQLFKHQLGYGLDQRRPYSKKDDEKPCPPQSTSHHTLKPDSSSACQPKKTTSICDFKQIRPPIKEPACEIDIEANKRKYRLIAVMGSLAIFAMAFAAYTYGKRKTEKVPIAPKGKKKNLPIIKDPPNSNEIPSNVKYLLIGGGTASFSAFRAIKSTDPTAEVLVISNEGNYPYMRPPLSKEIWFNDDKTKVNQLIFKQWNGAERSLFYEPEDFYVPVQKLQEDKEHGGVAITKGWSVSYVSPYENKVYLEDGYPIAYEKCLIATGATPKTLNLFDQADPKVKERVSTFRNIADFQDLLDATGNIKSIAIIGGGFLGSELACSLARFSRNGFKVYQIFREKGNMARVLPDYLSKWTTEKVQKEGVQVISEACITGATFENGRVHLKLNTGSSLDVDQVVLAVGVEPNTTIAKKSGLEVDPDLGGFLVNTELQARSDLYAAGDCACFYDTKLGRRRVEHHDHAVVSGRLAGENMTGARRPYWHQSMFWSDLGPDVGYEAIGIVDSALPTVGVFAKAREDDSPKAIVEATNEPMRSTSEEKTAAAIGTRAVSGSDETNFDKKEDFGKGVIFYLRDDIVVGIVLWNVFNRMSIARQVLKEEKKYEDLNEVAKLFNIHEE